MHINPQLMVGWRPEFELDGKTGAEVTIGQAVLARRPGRRQ